MNKTLIQVLESTKKALNEETILWDEIDEKSFLSLLKSSGLSGIVLPYLDMNQRSERFKTLAKSMIYEFVSRDDKQMKLMELTHQLLNDHHIEHIFLKGSHLKKIYPKSYMRGMGDIDILIKEENMTVVKEIFSQEAILLDTPSPVHDLYRNKEGLIIEIHPRIHHEFNLKYGDYFKRVWEFASKKEDYEYALDPLFELLYLLYHLAKHLESSGIGLRSMLDIGIFVKHYESYIDYDKLHEQLENTHMEKFYSTVFYMNNVYFDIKTKLCNPSFQMNEPLLNQFTHYLLESGIHGQGEHFNPMVPRISNAKNKEKSRLSILFSIAFPSFKQMVITYPKLKKCFLLYPFYIMKRWWRLLVTHRRASYRKIKQLQTANQGKTEVLELFNEIGLN